MKKLKILSFTKFQIIIGFLFGLVAGILYSFGGLIIDTMVTMGWITNTETPGLSYGTFLAFGALIAMPLIGAGVGLVVGIVESILYSLFAKWLGKLSLDFEQ